MDPTEDEISQVIDFASLNPFDDRPLVIQALKNNNRNVEAVVMEYFDNPESFRQKFTTVWNESLFHADRDGNVDSTAFHVESVNQNDVLQGVTPPPEAYRSGTQSRPPSRLDDSTPLDRAVDWNSEHIGVGSGFQSQEEDEMQRALRESAQEAGINVPAQEAGIVENATSTPYFGPATRNDYDHGNWAMVPVGNSRSQSNDIAASLRKRVPHTPAFLIHGGSASNGNRLGGLLTILHEIPLARNILLETGAPADSYGFDSEWWKGKEILDPQTQAYSHSNGPNLGETDQAKPGFEEEIHRLMAFLDGTERSFGTTSFLNDLIPYANAGAEKQFYEHLGLRNNEVITPLYQVASLALVQGDDCGDEEAKFGLLEIEHNRSDYAAIKTLYESLDHLMWSDVLSWNNLHEDSKMAMFKSMGEIIAIKIGGDGPEESIDIPAELYPEKYLTSRKDEARRIQIAWCQTKIGINKIATERESLNQWLSDWGHRAYTKMETIQQARDQWKTYGEYLEGASRFLSMRESGFDTNRYPDYRAAPCQMTKDEKRKYDKVEEVVQLTEQILSDMEKRLQDLNVQLGQIQAKQRFLGKLLTQPDKPGRPRPLTCNSYQLRGVATNSNVVFVCTRQTPDLIDLADTPTPLDQWWKLSYSPNDAEAVKTEKIEIERVLREVWQETKTPLLIYATKKALDVERAPLTGALERFIRADNKAFHQELNQESSKDSNEGPRRPGLVDPISPSKRKHRSDSVDSMDTNRASIGSDAGQDPDNPFETVSEEGIQATSMETETPPPALPPRRHDEPILYRPAAATGGVSVQTNTHGADISFTMADSEPREIEEDPRTPEMQERQRPPVFMREASQLAEKDRNQAAMELNMSK